MLQKIVPIGLIKQENCHTKGSFHPSNWIHYLELGICDSPTLKTISMKFYPLYENNTCLGVSLN